MGEKPYLLTREHALIEAIKEWSGSQAMIGDDCAVLPNGLLVTTDTLVEGTHFIRGKISYSDLGWKAVAVNLSDVAAMAGRPRYLLVSATVPENLRSHEFEALYRSVAQCAKTYGAAIVGGDLTKGERLVLSVTVIADVHENGCLMRSGARAGDVIVVTGDFGASRAGFFLLNENEALEPDLAAYSGDSHALKAHVRPLPRLCESWSLVRRVGSRGALMDASDGLADALVQIARASDVLLEVDAQKLPIDRETREIAERAAADPLDWALYGGEDYELVGTCSAESFQVWSQDNPFIAIGVVKEGAGVRLKTSAKSAERSNQAAGSPVGDKADREKTDREKTDREIEIDLSRSFQQIDI